MLAFDDSIRILGLTFLWIGSAVVVLYAIYRFIRDHRISRGLAAGAAVALLLFSFLVIREEIEGDIEYNPWIDSKEQLLGMYSNGDKSIRLNADGTYQATGLSPTTAGTWSHRDWNLQLSDSPLQEPRIITRNGRLCIAPYYAGVDRPAGLLLTKETTPEGGGH